MPNTKNILYRMMRLTLLASVGFAVLFNGLSPALAATAPSLGTADSFGVLGGSTVTNTGATVVTGNLGVWPGDAITGFPPGMVTGTIHAGDAVAMQAQSHVTIAYNALAGQACDVNLTGMDLGGLTLTQGVYCFDSSAQLTGTLTLDAAGNPNAVFIFQMGSTLTTASSSRVRIINGGQDCKVFWQVGSSATLGTTTDFIGNILALTSITLNTGADVSGRTLARNAAVTMDTNDVAISVCAPTPTPTPTATPTATPTGTPTGTPTATPTPTPTPTPPVSCTSDEDCPFTQVCNTVTGMCVDIPCVSDEDCPAGSICSDMLVCIEAVPCESDEDCPPLQECNTSTDMCVNIPCESNEDCPAGSICSDILDICIVATCVTPACALLVVEEEGRRCLRIFLRSANLGLGSIDLMLENILGNDCDFDPLFEPPTTEQIVITCCKDNPSLTSTVEVEACVDEEALPPDQLPCCITCDPPLAAGGDFKPATGSTGCSLAYGEGSIGTLLGIAVPMLIPLTLVSIFTLRRRFRNKRL